MIVFYINPQMQINGIETQVDVSDNIYAEIPEEHLILSVQNNDYSFRSIEEMGKQLRDNESRYFSGRELHNGLFLLQHENKWQPSGIRYLHDYIDKALFTAQPAYTVNVKKTTANSYEIEYNCSASTKVYQRATYQSDYDTNVLGTDTPVNAVVSSGTKSNDSYGASYDAVLVAIQVSPHNYVSWLLPTVEIEAWAVYQDVYGLTQWHVPTSQLPRVYADDIEEYFR